MEDHMNSELQKRKQEALADLENGNMWKSIHLLRDEKIISESDFLDIEHDEPYCRPDIGALKKLVSDLK